MTHVLPGSGTNTSEDEPAPAEETDAQRRRIIDTIPVLAWCNLPDGSNEFLNQRWQDYTGLSQQEASGSGWQAAFHADDLGPLMERWRTLLSTGEAGEIEARLRRYDGAYRWFLIRVEPMRDERGHIVRWYGTSTDIEDWKCAEQAQREVRAALEQALERVRKSEDRLRLVIDTIPAMVASSLPDGTLDFA